jgi:peptidoglycan hydrolase-like protein with peptidoglycan-binding domain
MSTKTAISRSRWMAAKTAILACCLAGTALAQPQPGWGASPGGAVAPSGGGTPSGSRAPTSSPSGQSTGGSSTKSPAKAVSQTGRPAKVTISSMTCAVAIHCSTNPHQVSVRGLLLVKGSSLRRGMVVAFPHSYGAHIARNSPIAHLADSTLGLVVHVPGKAHSGRVMIVLDHGAHSNSYGPIHVVTYALHPPTLRAATPSTVAVAPSGSAFDGQGMWIWYVSQSDGGNLASIVTQAHAAGVTTLFIKSSDGSSNYWSQFSPELVQALHANGLKVCAWQYVYGTNPAGEANLGAEAVANGADCLVIDAESEYEGKYGAAQTYITDLRAKIGAAYPLGLASFPYVYYHTAFPYSVFLSPEGAQFNAPQMYWKDIGNSVDTTYANTYISNRVYGRPIFPLGQTYSKPSAEEVVRFREEAPLYGAPGISFWDFQETPAGLWTALSTPLAPLATVTPNPSWSELGEGSKGDPVLWMQEHLAAAIPTQATTGIFDATTEANLEQFQSAHGIAPSGHTEAATWQALLALAPVPVDWTGAGPKG